MRKPSWITATVGMMLAACEANTKPKAELAQQNKTPMIYIEPDEEVRPPKGIKIEQLVRLTGAEIEKTLAGRILGWGIFAIGDHAVSAPDSEIFKNNGKWTWSRSQRGPAVFFGDWQIRGDHFCVTTPYVKKASMSCRYVWRDRQSGNLLLYSIHPVESKSALVMRRVTEASDNQ